MSRESEKIRDEGIARFNELAGAKFDDGQQRHGGCLDETVTIERAEDEVLDQWFYLQSIRVKYVDRVEILETELERALRRLDHWKEMAQR